MKKYIVRDSSFKRIGKSLRYKKSSYTARTCLALPGVKAEALKQVITSVKLECRHLCQVKPRPSVLRVRSVDVLKYFSWKGVIRELKRKAPTFLAILQAAAQSNRPRIAARGGKRSKHIHQARENVVGMAAAVLLKERNQHMCKLQTIVGILLYAGHASKKVIYTLACNNKQ